MSGSAQNNPDSIFTWVFEANTGDRWGGWMVADSAAHAAGDSITTALGRYLLLLEEERGADLTPFGLEDGEVRTEWYYDAGTAQFLVTRNGTGIASGLAGLGSEIDAAWTSQGWVNFGRGGLLQINVQEGMRFTWVFEATSGDRVHGTLTGLAGSLAVGQAIATPHGLYRITGEQRAQAGDSEAATPGLVRTTRYFDAATGRELPLESAGTVATGQLGLGSELDRVWTGASWVQVGQGGARQADGQFSLFYWRFEATSGDRYSGVLWDSALAYQAGDVITKPLGRYVIEVNVPQGSTRHHAPGTVWIDSYFDAKSGQTMKAYMPYTAGLASNGNGLGNEQDWVWDGDEYDLVGQAGALQSDVESYSLFTWTFRANSGDRYSGFLYEETQEHRVGDVVTAAAGRYTIEAVSNTGAAKAHPVGTVWILNYTDSRSATTMQAYTPNVTGKPSHGLGLGNELDWVFDGTEWLPVGQGGAKQVDIKSYGLFGWTFRANSGDQYGGFLYEDTAAHRIGDLVTVTNGRYTIENLAHVSTARAHPIGTMWISNYADSKSGMVLDTYTPNYIRLPSHGRGLGNELDWVWDGTTWAEVGRGGRAQVDVTGFGLYSWRFEANSGDRYNGFLYANTETHRVGDIVTNANGRYVIEALNHTSLSPVHPLGTVWLNSYTDARSNAVLSAYSPTYAGRPSFGNGLGNELDWVWDGARWAPVGQGGAQQVDLPGFGLFRWRFEATSGDRYTGYIYADSALYEAGQVLNRAAGRYVIESVSAISQDPVHPARTVWIDAYYDAQSDRTLTTYYPYLLGSPSNGRGLGQEQDAVFNGVTWVAVGQAGAAQMDYVL